MKKIKLYLSILISLAFFSACDQLNDYPEFDDANAFVAFTSERISVKENADSVLVPVRLTSLASKSTTVTYEIIDGTALKGREYDVPAGASVLLLALMGFWYIPAITLTLAMKPTNNRTYWLEMGCFSAIYITLILLLLL